MLLYSSHSNRTSLLLSFSDHTFLPHNSDFLTLWFTLSNLCTLNFTVTWVRTCNFLILTTNIPNSDIALFLENKTRKQNIFSISWVPLASDSELFDKQVMDNHNVPWPVYQVCSETGVTSETRIAITVCWNSCLFTPFVRIEGYLIRA
jgi:hypothetical protein